MSILTLDKRYNVFPITDGSNASGYVATFNGHYIDITTTEKEAILSCNQHEEARLKRISQW